MLVLQERDGNNNPKVTYTRGNDLSGSRQGAGGIGGLLARSETINNQQSTAYYHSDGNGNITAMTDSSGNAVAKYLYDPFGNLLGMWGTLADKNTYRFSSKDYDSRLGLYYYGYRYYIPNFNRWLNRDPIEEEGGLNLYGYVGNDPVNEIDPLGLDFIDDADQFVNDVNDFLVSTSPAGGKIVEGEKIAAEGIRGAIKLGKEAGSTAKAIGDAARGLYDAAKAAKNLKCSINQINKAIQRGKAPKSITRADKGKIKGEQDNIHFSDGSAINRDGSFKHGGRPLTNAEKDFLKDNGFKLPK
jgi:RHS repeat-associated protein